MKHTRHSLFLAIIIGCILVASPTVWAQSLFSQNKPEQAQALRDDTQRANAAAIVQRDAAIAQRDAAVAAGNTAAAEQLTKAVAFWEKTVTATGTAASIANAQASGDVAAEDAGWATLGGMLPPPFNVLSVPLIYIVAREVRAWQKRRDDAAAIAKAKQEAAEAQREAQINEAAAKSIVNMVDQVRIAKPEVAAAMKDLAANSATDFTKALTPKASAIIEAERLT